MVDPWPPHSGNTNIAFNGQKMQSAVERYRTDKVTPPVDPTTSDVDERQRRRSAARHRRQTPARASAGDSTRRRPAATTPRQRNDAQRRNASLNHAYRPIHNPGSPGQSGRS